MHVHTFIDAMGVQRAHCQPGDCDACRIRLAERTMAWRARRSRVDRVLDRAPGRPLEWAQAAVMVWVRQYRNDNPARDKYLAIAHVIQRRLEREERWYD